MKPDSGDGRAKRVGDLIGEMGRERRALRAKVSTVVLLCISAFTCLFLALASLAGYIPYAVGPSVVLMVTSVAGFVTSVLEARRP